MMKDALEVERADVEAGAQPSGSPGPMAVTFEKVTYHISTRRQKQLFLLQGVSGYLRPATMTAVLGPSGSGATGSTEPHRRVSHCPEASRSPQGERAHPLLGLGKTTLLDILAGRKTVGRLDASAVLFNGCPATPAFLRHRLGYMEQHCQLLSLLTPREVRLPQECAPGILLTGALALDWRLTGQPTCLLFFADPHVHGPPHLTAAAAQGRGTAPRGRAAQAVSALDLGAMHAQYGFRQNGFMRTPPAAAG